MSMHEQAIAVVFKRSGRHVRAEVELEVEAVALRLPSGTTQLGLAAKLELLVETALEPERAVLVEMLRHVVLGNYGALNGRKGAKAEGWLDQMHPSQGALPRFRRSNRDNAPGMFVRNALLDETNDPSYALMCGLLVSMLDAKWVDSPEIDVQSLPESRPLSTAEARALVSTK